MQRSVVIVGGTHGNERTGVELLRQWIGQPEVLKRENIEKIILAIGNPEAVQASVRYKDHDLNRCFLPSDLSAHEADPQRRTGYEFNRARELVAQWSDQVEVGQSFIIDLHTTTSSIGPTVILTDLNPLNCWVAASVQGALPELRVITDVRPRAESPFVNSLSPYGFCVEVGPIAQGTVSHQILEWTRTVVMKSLDALNALFSRPAGAPFPKLEKSSAHHEVVTFAYAGTLDYPRSATGDLRGYVHPEREARDFVPIENGSPIFRCFDGSDVLLESAAPGEFFWPIFIGEAAYYEKGIAMVLTRRVVQKWN